MNGTTQPLVSIVIPAYNAAPTLRDTIDSVLRQTYQNLEVVVVDDGSCDATPLVLASFGDHVRSVRQTNGGLAAARNRGMAMARGELIAWMDADDLCTPERIATQVAMLLRWPDVALCASDFLAFDTSGCISPSYIAHYYGAVRRAPGGVTALFDEPRDMPLHAFSENRTPAAPRAFIGQVYERLIWGNFIHPPTVMFRRALLEAVGPLSVDIRNMCDYEWLLRASQRHRFAFLPLSLLHYRISSSQMSDDGSSAQMHHDLVDILQRNRDGDPAFFKRHAARFRRRQAEAYINLANCLVQTDRWGALRALLRASAKALPGQAATKVLVKLLIPGSLLVPLMHYFRD